MSNENEKDAVNNPKRASVRKLLVGGGVIGASQAMPDKWTKAVVNSVVVPAHAQTSLVVMNFNGMGAIP